MELLQQKMKLRTVIKSKIKEHNKTIFSYIYGFKFTDKGLYLKRENLYTNKLYFDFITDLDFLFKFYHIV